MVTLQKSQTFDNLVKTLKRVMPSGKGKSLIGEALGLLYIMKAWQILSVENKIPAKLNFENFYSFQYHGEQLAETFNELARHHDLFKFAEDEKELADMPKEAIGFLYSYVKNNYDLPSFGEFLLDAVKNKYYKAPASLSIFMQGVRGYVKIALKMILSDSSSIYSPNVFLAYTPCIDNRICYYLDNVDNELSSFITFLKIVDKINILTSSNDPLTNPRTVENQQADFLQTFDSSLLLPFSLPDVTEGLLPDLFNRFRFFNGKCDKEIAYLEHLLACTTKKIAAFLPIGMSFKEGLIQRFREYLVEKNLVDTIIQMPTHMLGANTKDYFLIVINKKRSEKNVLFVNLMHDRFRNKRSRNANLAILEDLGKFCLERTTEEDLSKKMVPIEDICASDCSFSVDRYLSASFIKNPAVQKTVKLHEVALLRRSQIVPPIKNGHKVFEVMPADLPTAGFIRDGKERIVDTASKAYNTYKLEALDIILSVKGIIGKVGIVEADSGKNVIASQAFHIIRLINPDHSTKARDAKFLYMFFKSTYGQSLLSSIASGNLSPQIPVSAINKIEIPWPKPEIRESVGKLFEEEIAIADKIIACEKEIQKIQGEKFLQVLQDKGPENRKGRILQKPYYKTNEEEVEEPRKNKQLLTED